METSDLIQIILFIISIAVAIWIPIKLSWEQQYSSLLDEYRSFDYAIALQGVIQFFVKECGNDADLIKERYKDRFIKEVENKTGTIDKENCLHFQRRLLAQFFWQLNECSKRFRIGKRRIRNDFTKSEAKLIKILIYMGYAIEEDPFLYKDISSSALVKKPSHQRGQNKGLSEIYQILKNSKRYQNHK
ncbi:MAG: hypothetical protein J5747_08295 [Spirochaetaceae bacterium]|nr:hypothetical protein [Spirochaetaceae bacterium]